MTVLGKNWMDLLKEFDSEPYGGLKDKRIEAWKEIITNLPQIESSKLDLENGIIVQGNWNKGDEKKAQEKLLRLMPWRKGPFSIGNVFIDAEWRSNMKWDRILDLNIEFEGKNILDVGSGNGYYGFRMLGKKAQFVICLEPNLSHLTQFLALNHFIKSKNIRMIPKRIEEINFSDKSFDLVLSMGVLYHQRNPENHLSLLSSNLKEGGKLILETLVAPGKYGEALVPEKNYANMPNVRFVHTKKGLNNLIKKTGLRILKIGSSVKTSLEEQRSTKWMPFRSLVDGLNIDLDKTVEGLPTPNRVVLVLIKS